MQDFESKGLSRRRWIQAIGAAAGSAASHRAMAAIGVADASDYAGPVQLKGDVKGASVLVLGAGMAGLVAAYELRAAGYQVKVLEYNPRAGGRNWSIRGGDTYTELGGAVQRCEFDKGLYLNPGPWRLPYHHHGVLDYCKRLDVAIEPFVQVNYNAYVHGTQAFGGKPQRYRDVQADYYGHVSELLAKAGQQHKLDELVTKEDQDKLLESLRQWGALDRNMAYVPGGPSSGRRGWKKSPGGGLNAAPIPSQPIGRKQLLESRLWNAIGAGQPYEMQTTLFQPVGGMDMISRAFVREIGSLIQYDAKVVSIRQEPDGKGKSKVTVNYTDAVKGGPQRSVSADWCVCTIPLSVLGQIDMQVGQPMLDAIAAVPYGPAAKIGLQFKRRFWEEDEQIYGGISYTDQTIGSIGYPNTDYFSGGKGVLLGGYFFGRNAVQFTSMAPADRLKLALQQGAALHPQYPKEFENGISVAWHRVPWILGCAGSWTKEARAKHYDNLCAIDGRIVLAGEHASFIPGWQEGAVLSSLDAISRLHQRALAA